MCFPILNKIVFALMSCLAFLNDNHSRNFLGQKPLIPRHSIFRAAKALRDGRPIGSSGRPPFISKSTKDQLAQVILEKDLQQNSIQTKKFKGMLMEFKLKEAEDTGKSLIGVQVPSPNTILRIRKQVAPDVEVVSKKQNSRRLEVGSCNF